MKNWLRRWLGCAADVETYDMLHGQHEQDIVNLRDDVNRLIERTELLWGRVVEAEQAKETLQRRMDALERELFPLKTAAELARSREAQQEAAPKPVQVRTMREFRQLTEEPLEV